MKKLTVTIAGEWGNGKSALAQEIQTFLQARGFTNVQRFEFDGNTRESDVQAQTIDKIRTGTAIHIHAIQLARQHTYTGPVAIVSETRGKDPVDHGGDDDCG